MTYSDALICLAQSRRFGMKLGLEPMRELARALGDPQRHLRFIHLAGTNGKGSTAAFCEACLRAAGFRVGLYTSPHLVTVRERIQIDRVPISETDFALGMETVQHALDQTENRATTFFEIMTALALWSFARAGVDWVVWETGLGGRLDATNIIDPEICIITNISLEHQEYLGDTLGKIAAEKAGILKPGAPLVCGLEEGAAANVIRARAEAAGCPLTFVQRDGSLEDRGLRGGKQLARIGGREWQLGLLGAAQIQNAACAIEAMRQLDWQLGRDNWEHVERPAIGDRAIAQGLAGTHWAGRFEVVSERPLIVLDGAHNPAAARALVETWRAFLQARDGSGKDESETKAHLVFAAVADKEISEMAELLRPLAEKVSLVRLTNERTADPALLAKSFSGLPCTCYDSVAAVWLDLINSPPESRTLVTGSLFLVGEMLAQRRDDAEEYRLNERLKPRTIISQI